MHANNVNHFAIHADDVERARKFYEAVFQWRFAEWGPPDFYLISTGDDQSPGIRGALQKRLEPLGQGCNGYECSIAVQNIKSTTDAIVQNGGQIVFAETEIPTVGKIVKFADTEGNIACAVQYEQGIDDRNDR